MYILANRDLELSCDEAVIKSFGMDSVSSYALTLLGRQEEKKEFSPLASHFSKRAVIERINAIMKYKKTSVIAIIIAIAMVAGVTTAFATNAATEIKAEESSAIYEADFAGEEIRHAYTTENGDIAYAANESDIDGEAALQVFATEEGDSANDAMADADHDALLAEYASFGLTFENDSMGGRYYYKGELVRYLYDNRSSNPFKFSGTVYDMAS